MKKIVSFIFLSIFFLLSIFFVSKTANAQGVSIFLNLPPAYNSTTGVQTICMPEGYLPVQGQLTVTACNNNPPSSATVPVYLVDGSNNKTLLGNITINNVPVNSSVQFSGYFVLPSNTPLGSYSIEVDFGANFCDKGTGFCYPVSAQSSNAILLSDCLPPTPPYIPQDGIFITKTVPPPIIYSTANCPAGSINQDGICIAGTKSSTIYSTANCPADSVNQDGICIAGTIAYKCGDNIKEGSEECDGTDSAACQGICIPAGQTDQCKCPLPTGNCTITGPGVIQQNGTASFSLAYSGMGSGTPFFTGGNPVCGDGATLGTYSCNSSGTCIFNCNNYSTIGGPYTVSARIQNVSALAQCQTQISVEPPLQVTSMVETENDCPPTALAPGVGVVNFSWTYVGNNHEKEFQIQVAHDLTFSPSSIDFSADSTGLDNPSGTQNSQSPYIKISPALNDLAYNTTYYWRVKVYDNQGLDSGWYYGGTTTTSPGTSFITAPHARPSPIFSYVPLSPLVKRTVYFAAGNSTCYGAGNTSVSCVTYNWDFGDPTSSDNSGIGEDVSHIYNSTGAYYVGLTVYDADGNSCYVSSPLNVGSFSGIPQWKEISPF